MAHSTTWIAVADSAHATIYAQTAPGAPLNPVPDGVLASPNLKGREIVSDRPGRSFDSAGQGRHATESEVDPRRQQDIEFVREVATRLEDHAKRGDFDRLILVAPPRTLGDLRAALDKNAKSRIAAEIAKDFVALRPDELRVRIADELRP
jgi:protein required for attachment to host cells